MGIVYRARRLRDGRQVAIKFAHGAAANRAAALWHESEALGRLSHPAIVRRLARGAADSTDPWFAMELLPGPSLRVHGQRLWARYRGQHPHAQDTSKCLSLDERHPGVRREGDAPITPSSRALPPLAAGQAQNVAGLLRPVWAALQHMRERDVVHCDLKPENMVVRSGTAVVIDFSLCRLPDATMNAEGTGGTAAYAAPEQAPGGRVDWRTDLYAMGCIIYELLTGICPFRGDYENVLGQPIVGQPLPPAALVRGMSADLEQGLLGMLSKRPDDRPEAMYRLQHALSALASTGDSPRAARLAAGGVAERTSRIAGA